MYVSNSKLVHALKSVEFVFYGLLLFYLINVSNTTDDDDEWTEFYGNNALESGVWEYLETISTDEDKMRNLSLQAHKKCFDVVPNITWVNASVKELHFPDNANFQPIKIDVLMYAVEGIHQFEAPGVPYFYHLTKGLKPDCVYYLIPHLLNESKILSLLPDHMCNLIMP